MSSLWIGNKIRLKPIDEEKILEYFNANDFYDTNYQRMAGSVQVPLSTVQLKEYVEKSSKNNGKNDEYFWMIEDLEGNVVGDINTSHCNKRNGTFYYGISILKNYWKKGYASEAIQIMLKFYFEELRYQKVNAIVYSFNDASQKLHQKCGFTEEGRLSNMIYTEGKYYDHIYYGMTKDEFMNR